jgi:hypothetical protein
MICKVWLMLLTVTIMFLLKIRSYLMRYNN